MHTGRVSFRGLKSLILSEYLFLSLARNSSGLPGEYYPIVFARKIIGYLNNYWEGGGGGAAALPSPMHGPYAYNNAGTFSSRPTNIVSYCMENICNILNLPTDRRADIIMFRQDFSWKTCSQWLVGDLISPNNNFIMLT